MIEIVMHSPVNSTDYAQKRLNRLVQEGYRITFCTANEKSVYWTLEKK